jgi:RNA polymerase sigma-70 factor (ECF subfamily)
VDDEDAISDRVLIGAAIDGDRDAFTVIVDRYGPRLHRYARAALPDAGAADEAVQDAFVAAWKGLDAFRAESTLRTWLFSILLNKINDHRRRRHIAPGEDWIFEQRSTDPTSDPYTAVSNKDFMTDLSVALAELPYRQRACWLLREVEGLQFPEIGVIMRLSAGAARGQVTRANTTLAERLATWR